MARSDSASQNADEQPTKQNSPKPKPAPSTSDEAIRVVVNGEDCSDAFNSVTVCQPAAIHLGVADEAKARRVLDAIDAANTTIETHKATLGPVSHVSWDLTRGIVVIGSRWPLTLA